MVILTKLVATIIVTYLLSYLIMASLAKMGRPAWPLLRLFLLPGIIIHESAHVIACWLTGTTILNVSFWSEAGGHVIHDRPRYPFISQPIISIAPFILGVAALSLLARSLPPGGWRLLILLALMISIAATLAPSKGDLTNAAGGLILLTILLSAGALLLPDLFTYLAPLLDRLQTSLLLVSLILTGLWLLLGLLGRMINPLGRK